MPRKTIYTGRYFWNFFDHDSLEINTFLLNPIQSSLSLSLSHTHTHTHTHTYIQWKEASPTNTDAHYMRFILLLYIKIILISTLSIDFLNQSSIIIYRLKKNNTTILEKIRKLRVILRSRFIWRRRGKNRRRNCEGKRELKKQEENHGYTLQNRMEWRGSWKN